MIFSIGLAMTAAAWPIVIAGMRDDVHFDDSLGQAIMNAFVLGPVLVVASVVSWAIDNVSLLSLLKSLP